MRFVNKNDNWQKRPKLDSRSATYTFSSGKESVVHVGLENAYIFHTGIKKGLIPIGIDQI